MGLYDREYYRDESSPGFSFGSATLITQLILINIAAYVVNLLTADWLFDAVALGALDWQRPWMLWRLVAYGFAHDPRDIGHILFNMLGLFFFGRDLEMHYGRKELLRFYLTAVVVAGTVWLIANNAQAPGANPHLLGASGAILAVLVVFAHHYPQRSIYIYGLLPVPAWLLVGLYVLGDLAMATRGGGGNVAYTAHLGGAAFGLLYYRLRWNLGRFAPRDFDLKRWFRRRPSLRLHKPEAEGDDLSKRVDEILDKISRQGEASLTRAERKTLEAASRRYQQQRRQ